MAGVELINNARVDQPDTAGRVHRVQGNLNWAGAYYVHDRSWRPARPLVADRAPGATVDGVASTNRRSTSDNPADRSTVPVAGAAAARLAVLVELLSATEVNAT